MFVRSGQFCFLIVRCGQYADAASTRIGNYFGMLHDTWSAAASSANQVEEPELVDRKMTPLLPHRDGESFFVDLCVLDAELGNGSKLPEDFRFASKSNIS